MCHRKELGTGESASQALVGKRTQEVSNQILDYLRDPMVGTICLWGQGGVGKTTIMRNITQQLKDGIEIFDQVIWVTISENMSLKRLQDEIASQLDITLSVNDDVLKRAMRISEGVKKIKTWFFVLDDAWGPVPLDKIGIPTPEAGDGCKIVITSRFYSHRVDKLINLTPLSDEEAWGLFVNKCGDRVLHPSIEGAAKEIVKHCMGLPIAIVTVGCAMRDKEEVTCWRDALEDLERSKRGYRENGTGLLRFGYNQLKNDPVRMCFLYCALFPEDYKFEPEELIRYWMAGDCLPNNGILASVGEGAEILRELKDANMIQMVMEGGHERLTMHDLHRELALTLVEIKHNFLVRAGLLLNDFPPILEYRHAKSISLIKNRIDRLNDAPSCRSLTSLFLRNNPLSHVTTLFFRDMPKLQVLDMSYSGITHLPQSLSSLASLRVLFLQYCTSLKKIPSLENLQRLQALNLRGTLIKVLPPGMKSLVKLKSLDLSETIKLSNVQSGLLSSLSNLEELHLQGSLLCRMQSSIVAEFSKEIRSLKQLTILTLSTVGFEDHLDTILHLQEQNLKSFSINVYGSTQDYAEDV
ncbi:hypothetical protein ACHQM5_001150 [Ranunculus cassubicifolius]